MQVNITTRHCTVPSRVKAEAEKRLQRLSRYEPKVDNAVVEFDHDHGDKLVATRIFLAGSHSLVATGSGETFESALDRSIGRIRRQLKRRRERVRDHQSVKLSETYAADPGRRSGRETTDG